MTKALPETDETETFGQRLIDRIKEYSNVVVAFSGGVDSAVVAAAAHRACGNKAVAVLAISASVPSRQIEIAQQVASEIGIQLQHVETTELERFEYKKNDSQRCFFCKETLYKSLEAIAALHSNAQVLSGTNADDLGDHRPGIAAGRLANVKTPLADLEITKQNVRALAKHWKLSVWDLPAGPCLASRIAYGEEVTMEKMQMIDAAENWLRDQGIAELRVRLHPGLHGRIEVPTDQISSLTVEPMRSNMVDELKTIGFKFVSVDLEGFKSGNMNRLISIQSPRR